MDSEITKACTGCGNVKPASQFQKRRASRDGLGPRCKTCTSDYDRARAGLPHRVAARKAYQLTDAYKDKHAYQAADWRTRNRVKMRAHSAVQRAVRNGTLVRPLECEGCGPDYSGKLEAHHDDYTRPLDVKWLCDPCHKKRHVELRMEARPYQDRKWNINAGMGFQEPEPEPEALPDPEVPF